MTTAQLAKEYGVLTTPERFALIANASHRGDDQEVDRLLASAARGTQTQPDTTAWLIGFQFVCDHHRQIVIESAGTYLAERIRSFSLHPVEDQKRWEEIGVLVRLLAYKFQVHLSGWEEFCKQLEVPSEFLPIGESNRPGTDLIQRAKRLLAEPTYLTLPSEAEVRDIITREGFGDTGMLITAASVARELSEEFETTVKVLRGQYRSS